MSRYEKIKIYGDTDRESHQSPRVRKKGRGHLPGTRCINSSVLQMKATVRSKEASDVKRLKELEEENERLKKMYANLSLVHEALKDAVEKKALTPYDKSSLVNHMITEHKVSGRQAFMTVHISSSTQWYKKKRRKDELLITLLQELVEKYPAIEFWHCYFRIRRMSYQWNHKRLYRVYTALKLNIRRRRKKRLPARIKQALFKPDQPNTVLSVDFMADSLWNGRTFQLLNIVDDFNREVLHIETDTSLPTARLIRCLEMLKLTKGLPKMIQVDNGPKLISAALDTWSKENNITLIFIQPGSPCKMAMWKVVMAVSDVNY
jgi:putative transposase